MVGSRGVESSSPPPRRRRRRAIVLVVEDAFDARQLYCELLDFHGFHAEPACDGAEALQKVRVLAPDVVLLDLSLPGISGWDVARALRSHAHTRTIPIIAITAHATAPEIDRAREAGCDSVFVKPAKHAALIEELRRAVTRTR